MKRLKLCSLPSYSFLLFVLLAVLVASCSTENDPALEQKEDPVAIEPGGNSDPGGNNNPGGNTNPGGATQKAISYKHCGIREKIVNASSYTNEGIVCISDFSVPGLSLAYDKLEYKYYFSTFFGEPLQRGHLKWTGKKGEDKLNTTIVRASVYHPDEKFSGYYYRYAPIVDAREDTWSYDATGSPNWNKVFFTDPECKN